MLPGDTHVWILNTEIARPAWDKLLSPTEIAIAERLLGLYQVRYKSRRAALRLLLGRHLKQDPASIHYSAGKNGKPYLLNNRLSFNVSHSENMAAIALTVGCEIGIDIERKRLLSEYAGAFANFFTNSERRFLEALPLVARDETFSIMWTRKEAILKAYGTGIWNAVNVPVTGVNAHGMKITVSLGKEKQSYYVYDIDVEPDFVASVALSRKTRQLFVRSMEA